MLDLVKSSKAIREYPFISADKFADRNDEELVEQVLAGATELFEVLVRRYNQRLYRIQRSYIRDEELVKDALQSTYLKAFEKLDQFRGEAQFSTWITRIAIHEALKHRQRENRYAQLQPVGASRPETEEESGSGGNPEEEAVNENLRRLLENAIDTLGPKYRSVYMMREIEQMSTKETAKCLNLTRSNVKVRLHRARRMLREELENRVKDTDIFNFRGRRCDLIVFSVMKLIKKSEGRAAGD